MFPAISVDSRRQERAADTSTATDPATRWSVLGSPNVSR
ncbi:hypothetical protein BZL30_4765 [Mycobacterium kansasii]|uniref:Uncharacterized protein n=1 Tax=Mycobacterium kansasii TaxID=1768 RepID=A0A1V3X360_MYCKA|nr:hypothetical protein BZL30_4765 [Mycobacterium kansasii]OOK77371.1 hypothetical protein BZL29_3974 [Mycobacterium kansasii]